MGHRELVVSIPKMEAKVTSTGPVRTLQLVVS